MNILGNMNLNLGLDSILGSALQPVNSILGSALQPVNSILDSALKSVNSMLETFPALPAASACSCSQPTSAPSAPLAAGPSGAGGSGSASAANGGITPPNTDTSGLEAAMAAANALGIKLATLTSQNEANKAMNQASMDAFKGLPR